MTGPTESSQPQLTSLLFDFDGTLAPNLDLPQMRRDVVAFTETHQVPSAVYKDRYIVEVIDASHQWLRQHHPEHAADYYRRAHQLITDIELDAATNTEPFEFAETVLQQLRDRRLKLGVVTRNCRAAVLRVFPHLLELVDTLRARDDVSQLKPDPGHLEQALDDLQCPAAQSAMIGDGRLDMHSGRQLDMYCIGVLTGSSNQHELTAAGAHTVLSDCAGLTQLLR